MGSTVAPPSDMDGTTPSLLYIPNIGVVTLVPEVLVEPDDKVGLCKPAEFRNAIVKSLSPAVPESPTIFSEGWVRSTKGEKNLLLAAFMSVVVMAPETALAGDRPVTSTATTSKK